MAETDDYAKRTARIKNLLSSYYGDAGQPGTPGGPDRSPQAAAGAQPGSPAAAAPRSGAQAQARFGGGVAMSMDSPAFNADYHIQQMLRGLSLERLLAEHRGMAREIKNLDSDMQQLVYENYNKFITATGALFGGARVMHACTETAACGCACMGGVAARRACMHSYTCYHVGLPVLVWAWMCSKHTDLGLCSYPAGLPFLVSCQHAAPFWPRHPTLPPFLPQDPASPSTPQTPSKS